MAVPSPLSTKATPGGSAPVSLSEGSGVPVVVRLKLPAVPAVKVVEAAEVMAGASSTVRVKSWVASGLTPFCAVMVIG